MLKYIIRYILVPFLLLGISRYICNSSVLQRSAAVEIYTGEEKEDNKEGGKDQR